MIFTPNDWLAKTITISAADNTVQNDDTTATITHRVEGNYAGVSISDVQVNIADNDSFGFVFSSPSNNATTTESRATSSFTVKLRTEPTDNVTLTFATDDSSEGEIVLNIDDPSSTTVQSKPLTFTSSNWSEVQTIMVAGADDEVDDGDIVYHITVSNSTSNDPNYHDIANDNIGFTNTDNDTASIELTESSLTTTEASGDAEPSFGVHLGSKPIANVVINVNVSDPDEGQISNSILTFTSDNWQTNQFITVTGKPDSVDDGDVTYNITLTVNAVVTADAKYAALATKNLPVTNIDEDETTYSFDGKVYTSITSEHTSKVWLDRNTGADQVCTLINDASCYGNLYQWGRNHDGHQLRTQTNTITGPVNTLSPGSEFVTNATEHYDWTSVDDDGLDRIGSWSSTSNGDASQYVCPAGFRVPTMAEFVAEFSGNSDDVMTSFLKLPYAGYRDRTNGSIFTTGVGGTFWTTTINTNRSSYTQAIAFSDGVIAEPSDTQAEETRASGFSVRCIKAN